VTNIEVKRGRCEARRDRASADGSLNFSLTWIAAPRYHRASADGVSISAFTDGRNALLSWEVRLKLNLHRLKPDGIQGNIASFLRSKLNLHRLKRDGIRMDFSHRLGVGGIQEESGRV